MAKKAWETMVAYKLVWLRVLGYFIVPAWLMWEVVSKDQTSVSWEVLGFFDKFQIVGKAVAAGVISIMAFLDQSLQKKRDEIDRKSFQDKLGS